MLPAGMTFETGDPVPLKGRQMYSADQIAEAEASKTKVSFGEAWDAAKYEASTIDATARHVQASEDAVVEDYKLPDEGTPEHEELIKDVPEHRLEEFGMATSPASAARIKQNILESEKASVTMSQYGGALAQFGVRGLATLTDPASLALGVATAELGGIGYFSRSAFQLTRAARFARIGTLSAVENAALERYLETSYSNHSLEGPGYAALLGFVLGGGFAAAPRSLNKVLAGVGNDALNAADHVALRSAGIGEGDHAGAASTGGLRRTLVPEENANSEVPYTTNNAVRFSIASDLGKSESGAARRVGQLVEDAVGTTSDASARPIPATHRQQILMNQRTTEMYRAAKPAFREWLKEQGLGWHKRFNNQTASTFMRGVTDAIESGEGSVATLKAARAINDSMGKILEEAKKAGVKGAEEVIHSASHVPHLWTTDKISQALRVYRGGVEKLFTKGLIKAGVGDITEIAARRMAKTMITTLSKAGAGLEFDLSRVMTRDGLHDLKGMLVNGGMHADEADGILYPFLKDAEKGGKPMTRLRHRALIDVDETVEVLNHETGVLESLGFKSLMERNAERLHNVYTRQLSGRIALAKAGIPDLATYQKLVNAARAEMYAAGESREVIDATAERMEFVWKAITGAPLEANPLALGSKAGRALNHFNFMRLMNQMGFAQAMDASHVVSENGIATLLMHIPAFGDMFKRVKDGSFAIKNELANEWEALGMSGSDILRESMTVHAGADSDLFYGHGVGGMGKATASSLAHKGLDKFEGFSHHGRRITNAVSFFAGVNTALHRLSGRVVAQKFMDMALDVKAPNMARLKTIGLDDETLAPILEQLRKHATTEDSMFGAGRKIRKMNIDKWDNADAADAFTHAAYAMGRRIIQENDVGGTAMWMHSTTGKILTQFRGFQIAAWEKNTLHNWNQRDWQTASTWMLNTMLSTGVYAVRTQLNSYGRSDREEFLKREMSLSKIARSGYSMAAWSSIVPMTVDTAWMFTGGEAPLVGRASSSGLSHGVLGIPAVDLVFNQMPNAAQGLRNAILPGNQMTGQQARSLANLMFWSNATGVRNLIQNVTKNMPRQARSRYEALWYNPK